MIFLQLLVGSTIVPGVLEGRALHPYVLYLGVADLAERVEELISSLGCLPAPAKSILRTGFQRDPTKRLGRDMGGLEHILTMAEELETHTRIAGDAPSQLDTSKLAEAFGSARNELLFHNALGGLIPTAFHRLPPPQWRLSPSFRPSFEAPWKGMATSTVDDIYATSLSPGSMV